MEQSLSMLGIVPARAEDPPGSRLPTEASTAVFDELRVRTLWTGPLRVVRAKRLITADWRVAVVGDYGDSEGGRFLPPVSTLQLLQQALQVDLLAARPARTVVWVSRSPPDGGPLGMRAVTEPMYVMYRCLAAALGHEMYQIRLPTHSTAQCTLLTRA